MLEAEGLGKRAGPRWILAGVSLRIAAGERLWVTGPNGAGKTTLLRILAGASRPSAGQVRLDGLPLLPSAAALRGRIGYLAHEPLLLPELTAWENLCVLARIHGVPPREARAWLDRAGLAAHEEAPVRRLSRGQRQRLALARAVLHRPRLLVLDEPGTALDAEGRALLAGVLAEHAAAGGVAVIATHEPVPDGEARLVLQGGRPA